ncbi:transglutaminase-like domain-containing protein [Shewanella sairae]|nr:transglutaminase-like domain-containing protein [Shewanella sairae]MCL1132344.1 transglutaminase-like domain-containing protein [Shewanella sairae]
MAVQHDGNETITVVEAIFAKPSSEIDLARAKLTIDKLVDPSVDVDATLAEIDNMVNEIRHGLSSDLTGIDTLLSLSAFLYESGYWNRNQPLQYDFNDPLGQSINSKLLSNYLDTKKGNCISMPILYVIIAEKLGLDVTLSTAPLHVFVKFRDPLTGKYLSLEATDRGQLVNHEFYKSKSTIKPEAINNGLYLQPLSKKESVGVIAVLLSEYYAEHKQWQNSIDVAKVVLKHYPNYAYAMIKIGNGYSRLLSEKVAEVKAKKSYTIKEKEYMDHLYQQNVYWFNKAEKLGWQMPSQHENETYLNSIKQRRSQLIKASKG